MVSGEAIRNWLGLFFRQLERGSDASLRLIIRPVRAVRTSDAKMRRYPIRDNLNILRLVRTHGHYLADAAQLQLNTTGRGRLPKRLDGHEHVVVDGRGAGAI